MKISIGFFGLPRGGNLCYQNIDETFIKDLSSRYDVEIYYHFFKQDRVVNPRSKENGSLNVLNYVQYEKYQGLVEDDFSPFDTDFGKKIAEYGDCWSDEYRSLSNLIKQLYSIKELYNLILKNRPETDVFLFLRPDLYYFDKIKDKDLLKVNLDPKSIMLPSWQWWGGYNDRFCIAGKESIFYYANRLDWAERFCNERREPLNGEKLLKYVLNKNFINVYARKYRASRVRIDQNLKKEDFSQFFGMGGFQNILESFILRRK